MKRIDLHTHSKFSDDGEFTPEELLAKCTVAQLDYFAIADHNSVKGSRIALANGAYPDVTCIPAIEIDCTLDDVNYHMLGYGVDVTDPIFEKIEEHVAKQERVGSQTRMQQIRDLGILFEDAYIKQITTDGIVSGEAIAEAAMKFDVEKNHPLLQPYYPGGERSDNPYVNFYWDYCSSGKPGYVEILYPRAEDIVNVLHDQGAIAVLAHPGMNVKEVESRMKRMIEIGIDGIEVYSSYHSLEQIAYYQTWAEAHALLITCGSDYHGKTKPSVKLGQCVMPEDKIILLSERLESLRLSK